MVRNTWSIEVRGLANRAYVLSNALKLVATDTPTPNADIPVTAGHNCPRAVRFEHLPDKVAACLPTRCDKQASERQTRRPRGYATLIRRT
jgi:hypothetical protein